MHVLFFFAQWRAGFNAPLNAFMFWIYALLGAPLRDRQKIYVFDMFLPLLIKLIILFYYYPGAVPS